VDYAFGEGVNGISSLNFLARPKPAKEKKLILPHLLFIGKVHIFLLLHC
jgi:hypothetical protein